MTYLAALLIYLNVLHAAAQSFLYIIPTPHSVHHLAKLVGDGCIGWPVRTAGSRPSRGSYSSRRAASAWSPSRSTSSRSGCTGQAIAGLPLLVVFMAPIATTANVRGLASAVAFLLAAVGYLALLSSEAAAGYADGGGS